MGKAVALIGLAAVAAIGGGIALSKHGGSGGSAVNNPFDKNLPANTLAAVQTALANETDPNKLRAFAQSLLPDFPLAAAALNAKAAQLSALPPGVLPPPSPAPGAQNVVFIPPPSGVAALFPNPGSVGFVNTNPQPDPQNPSPVSLRSEPSDAKGDASVLTSIAHGTSLTITGPIDNSAASPGFLPVKISGSGQTGFINFDFLAPSPPGIVADSGQPAGVQPAPAPIPGAPPFPGIGSQGRVVTQSGQLNLRSSADTSSQANVLEGMNPGSIVTITGPATADSSGAPNTFLPVQTASGRTGFASAANLQDAGTSGSNVQFVAPPPTSPLGGESLEANNASAAAAHTAGYNWVHAGLSHSAQQELGGSMRQYHGTSGLSLPDAAPTGPVPAYASYRGQGTLTVGASDLATAAAALQSALGEHACRAYDEPIVKRFQLAAKSAGLYAGKLHGSYDALTRGALVAVVGNRAAPACFAQSGGPFNHDTYWQPAASG